MISNALETGAFWSMAASRSAQELLANSLKDDGTWKQDLSARALFVAQTVISIVSLPLSFLGMLFGSAIALCTEGREAAFELLKRAIVIPLTHLMLIVASPVGALSLHLTAKKLSTDSIKDDGTWSQALTARVLFIAEAVIAIVKIPLTFLALLLQSGVELCNGKREDACTMLKNAVVVLPSGLAIIPTNLIAAFVPHSLQWNAPGLQVRECIKGCISM